MLPHSVMWLPITLAMIFAGVILSWLFSRADPSPVDQAPPDAAGNPLSGSAAEAAQADVLGRSISPVFSPEVQRWAPEISRWSSIYNLDPNLIATVMQIESCGHPSVYSSSGAIGLFQVMPFHFLPGEDPLDPQTNAKRGLAYLARGLELSGGRTDLALAGYNGGHSVIARSAAQWSAETQRYVGWGSGILDEIASGSAESSSLLSWMNAGGSSLCRRASAVQVSLPAARTP